MPMNPKIVLYHWLRDLGFNDNVLKIKAYKNKDVNQFIVSVEFIIKDIEISGTGIHEMKQEAEAEAFQAALDFIKENCPKLNIDWNELNVNALKGDALIKLAIAMSHHCNNPELKSNWIQKFANGTHLASIFDKFFNQQHPSVALFGNNLGQKRKSIVILNYIWNEYGKFVVRQENEFHYERLVLFLEEN
jgi:hypothetical protein